ncbi:acyl-CoA desaturase [Brevundimonas sp. S30B]|uniref:acyl-CoA desaturase n=1 Tax=unclassified Brevundimonas TaxID=2622653 RepID=UPI0010720B51|nr:MULTISPECIES: acyl-CoA desaturase [unclassified Brevundimonas]QBX38568.1 acyl-CoA desaturase [Brevundimonas sp. MF30-B]TFW00482.1 acyl-CoA desaturase [Brevundimonas sp. S30B]TFW01871.1 acyl-CoA desaturase [Brevundimonas sp. S30B]
MMKPVLRMNGAGANPCEGRPVIDWPKAVWNGSLLATSVVAGPLFFSWSAFALFVILTYLTLLVGHSVGMHRMLIHRSFQCSKPLERLLIYVGVIVGVAGPFGIIRVHDMRDWAQRQPVCHDFFAHTRGFWRDLSWQLFYRFDFGHAPTLTIESSIASDPFYRFLEASWRWQQGPIAVALFLIGGWPWVVWGVAVRVIVSTVGHWTITYFCHNPGPGRWTVKGAYVQATNLRGLGLLTYGECWHNNHHAFPESARIGLEKGQVDPGWFVIRSLERARLIWNVGRPREEGLRDDLHDRSTLEPIQ